MTTVPNNFCLVSYVTSSGTLNHLRDFLELVEKIYSCDIWFSDSWISNKMMNKSGSEKNKTGMDL